MLNFFANKKVSSLILVISLVIGSFGMANFAWAGPIDAAVTMVIGWVASLIIVVCGWILTIAISSIITITSYNNFISEPSIVQAWVIVRDLCNMFFVLILLVIAFATILRIPNYEWKKLLPKLLIMAILINFSKTICGLLIDFSQVILLTFTNAFSGGGGNFIAMLGVENFLTVAKSKSDFWGINEGTLNLTNTVAAMMFVIILLIVATVAMVAIMIVFLMRMIMLWIYIILSPLAYLLMAFPAGQKYASQWWSDFIKYLINGPVLAFFIWLALIVMSNPPPFDKSIFFDKGTLGSGADNQLIKALQGDTFIRFILAIGLLVGGLMISQQIGGIGSAMGMNMLNNLKSKGIGALKTAAGVPLAAGMALGKFGLFKAGRMADTLQMKGQGLLAKGVSKVTKGYFGEKYQAKSLNYRMIKEGWDRGQAVKMRDYEGTKAGAWQDQFNRTTSASIGIPIVSQIMRKKAEKQAKVHEDNMKKEQKGKEEDEVLLAKETNPAEQEKIKNRIKGREEKINEEKVKMRDEINKSQTAWTLGKLPPQRRMRLQEQERGQEAYSRIAKEEDLSEENKVHSFQAADRAGNESDKRGYIMHLADSNSINALFDDMGEDFNAENIIKVFEEKFGEAAGDVLAEVSRRAEAVGNYKFMGLHKFDVAQGRNRVASVDEQSAYVDRKDKEKYAQTHGRTTHFDSLYDKTKEGVYTVSDNGLTQLLHIASSAGRKKEIDNGNYQARYGEMVVKLEDNIRGKAIELEKNGRGAEAAGLIIVLDKFKENYGPGALAKKGKKQSGGQEESD